MVGGISRTVERDGWRFDIGGHRFFTKVPEVEDLWHEILPDEDFLLPPAHEPHLLRRQVLRLPAQRARTRCRTSASSRRSVCVLLVPRGCGSVRRRTRRRSRAGSPPASAGASTASSSRPTPRRCGACRPTRSRPTGPRSGSRTCRSATRSINALLPEAQPEGDHLAHRGVPVPEVRARDDVGACAREKVEAAGTKVRDGDASSRRSTTRTAGRSPSPPSTDGVRHDLPARPRHLVDAASRSCCRRWTRRSPDDVPRGGRRPHATATSSPSRSSCPSEYAFPDNWIYVHSPEVKRRPHPELRLVVAVHGEGGPHLPRPRVLRVRGRRPVGRWPTTTSSSSARASSRTLGLVDADEVEAGYVVRMPKAYPVYDERLQGERRRPARRGSSEHAPQRAPRRPQRHAQVQQPGPLDVHRDADASRTSYGAAPRHLGGERRGGVPRGELPLRRHRTIGARHRMNR